MAMTIVEQSGGQYHVLLIIADGQVLLFKIRTQITRDNERDFITIPLQDLTNIVIAIGDEEY